MNDHLQIAYNIMTFVCGIYYTESIIPLGRGVCIKSYLHNFVATSRVGHVGGVNFNFHFAFKNNIHIDIHIDIVIAEFNHLSLYYYTYDTDGG